MKMNEKSWKFPALEDVIFLAIFAFLVFNPTELLSDGDTGWPIRAGEWMIQNHRLPVHDLFSFYTPNSLWSNYCWFFDVIIGEVH